jgi:hypothetical protein
MRKSVLIIILLLLAATAPTLAQAVDDSDSISQYTSWSIVSGPNVTGYRIYLENTDNAPDRILPLFGAEVGSAISYHISKAWQLQLTALACYERVNLVNGSKTTQLASAGGDLSLQAGYELWIKNTPFQILAGPYTHFIIKSKSSDHTISNPFSRTIANNPRTDNPLFAMGNLNAGIVLTLAYKLTQNLQLSIDLKWGITDLLNADSHQLYVKPYKIASHIAYTF